MSVYVDNAQLPFGRMKMCHMLADTSEELRAMADKIGLAQKHIQYEGAVSEHFDLSMSYRDKAIKEGAIPVEGKQLVALLKRKRVEEAKGLTGDLKQLPTRTLVAEVNLEEYAERAGEEPLSEDDAYYYEEEESEGPVEDGEAT